MEELTHLLSEPAHRRVAGRIGIDIGASKPVEFLFTQECQQAGEVVLQYLQEPQTVALHVDAYAFLGAGLFGAHHLTAHVIAACQHTLLKIPLQFLERAHDVTRPAPARRGCTSRCAASSLRMGIAMCRAWSSSASSSASGGMLASRSIMVDTGPKCRTASAYRSQTPPMMGWSWVSTMMLPLLVWPARWNWRTRAAGTPRR